jgi:DnaK suppressor protein
MPLTALQTGELRRAIAERRKALIGEIRRDLAKERDEPYSELAGATPDAGDASVADLLADLEHAELTRDLGELRELEAARQRLAGGRYGACADCGADIPFSRLRASPGALRCLPCQDRHEKTHAPQAGPRL